MKFKTDIYLIFPKFKSLVEKYFKTSILALYSDCGGEYNKLTLFLSSNDIQHFQTPPYTPEHNAIVE